MDVSSTDGHVLNEKFQYLEHKLKTPFHDCFITGLSLLQLVWHIQSTLQVATSATRHHAMF